MYGFYGVGRFVLGFSDVMDVVEGDKLRSWLADRVEQMREKFTGKRILLGGSLEPRNCPTL